MAVVFCCELVGLNRFIDVARALKRILTSLTAWKCGLLGVGISIVCGSPALAQRIENQVAVFAALDKVTARISKLEVKLGETVKFGALRLTPRVCYSRPPTEPPKTSTFVEVLETQQDGKELPLFTGWMFAESPGLNAVEHPVYDVWLTQCNGPKAVAQRQQSAPAAAAALGKGAPAARGGAPATSAAQDTESDVPRRRPPR